MAQTYTVRDVRKTDQWDSQYGTFQTYALALEGIGEPVKLNKKVPVKDEPAKGGTLYGTIEEKSTRNGSTYRQLKLERPDTGPYSGGAHGYSKRDYQPRDDAAIRAQWAIGQAMSFFTAKSTDVQIDEDHVAQMAQKLYAMVDRVKGGSESTDPKENLHTSSSLGKSQDSTPTQNTLTISGNEASVEEEQANAQAARDAQLIKSFTDGTPVPDEVFSGDEPINLDDIPF